MASNYKDVWYRRTQVVVLVGARSRVTLLWCLDREASIIYQAQEKPLHVTIIVQLMLLY
jgi:hypothetical protein